MACLIVGDVVPPNVSQLTDVTALLRFAAANGFLIAALRGLVRTVFSDYPRLRAALGFTLYDEGRHDRQTRRRRLCRDPRAAQSRTQPGAHDLHGA